MQKVIRIFTLIVIVTTAISFSTPPKEKINWITLEQLNTMYSKEPKPILFDVYTDWCGWCKEMDRKTYNNQKVADYINSHYYAVKLNAESTESFFLNKKAYGFNPETKNNSLAEYLLFGRMEYPSTVFLSAIDARPAPLSGYLKPKEIEAPLKYFGDGAHTSITFVEFNQKLKKEW